PVADVAMDENVVRVVLQGGQRIEIARIGQCVEVDHAGAGSNGFENEVATDETGTAGDKPCRHVSPRPRAQNGMSSSERSSIGGGADWRCGACRCGADSWRGRDMRSPPPPPPPSPRPPSICISLATISVKNFSTPSWPVYLS